MGILKGSLRQERPQNLSLNEYLRRLTDGNRTWSGMNVDAQTALTVSAVFACRRVISEDIGKLPFVVYYQSRDRERERATNSPLWRLIHDAPNPTMSSQQFRESLTDMALARGNGLARKTVVQGQVRELWPVHPDRVTIEQLSNGELLYHVRATDGTEEHLTRAQIFHLPGLTIAGSMIGVSVIDYARQTVGNAMGANRYAGTFFGNGARPSGVFKHPKSLSKEARERFKQTILDATSGDKTNSLLLIEEGMDYSPISISNSDSQFLESRTFEVVEICRWFRVPPHKIHELSRATFSNIEQQAMEYVTDTLMPWAKRWEAAVNQQVIVSSTIYAELLFEDLLRGTTLDRYNAYAQAAGGSAPWMTRNEIRRRENLAPLPGLDDVLVPLNMAAGRNGGSDGNDSTS